MKSILTIILSGVLIGLSLLISISGCTRSAGTSVATVDTSGLTEEEKHRLYTAALVAASESPLESESFAQVCRKIGIFDEHSNQNDKYMAFVTAHIEWALKTENEQFKREIKSREKARDYLKKYLR